MRPSNMCTRANDGAKMVAGCRDGYHAGNAFADVVSGTSNWFFRLVRPTVGWWKRRRKGPWEATGETFETDDPSTFSVDWS